MSGNPRSGNPRSGNTRSEQTEKNTDTNVMPGNPSGVTPTNDNNTQKVEIPKPVTTQHDPHDVVTIDDGDDTDEEDKNHKEMIKEEEGYKFQVNSPSLAELCVWEASLRHIHRWELPGNYPYFKNNNS